MKKIMEIAGVFRTGVGRKFALPVLLALALFTAPFFFAFNMERVTDETNAEVADRSESIDHLSEMEGALRREQVAVFEMIFEHRPESIVTFTAAQGDVQFWHDQAMEHATTFSETTALDECQVLHNQISDIVVTQVIPVLETPDPDHALLSVSEKDMQIKYERMSELRAVLDSEFEADRSGALARQKDSRELASEMMWASIIGAVGLGTLIAGINARRLVMPIRQMGEASLQIARGDLSQRVEVKGHDELAAMGSTFNDMADSLERRTQQLEREKAHIRSIHQSIGDGLMVVDRAGVIISMNPAAERILDRPATKLERTTNTGVPELQAALSARIEPHQMVNCWEAKNCTKSECPSHGSNDRRCWLQCGTFCYNQIQGTFRQKRDACERCDVFRRNSVLDFTLDINERHYSTSILPILDDQGQEEGRTIVMHDITDLQNAKEAMEQQSAELAAINSVSEAVSGSLDLGTILLSALDRILDLTAAEAVAIHLLDSSGKYLDLLAERGYSEAMKAGMDRLPRDAGLGGVAIRTSEPVWTNDVRSDERVFPIIRQTGFRSVLVIPLISKRKTIGIIAMFAMRSGAYDENDAHRMNLIANQVAVAIENSILYEDSLRHSREMLARNRIVSTLTSTVELESVFDEFVVEIRQLVDFEKISVVVTEGDGSVMKAILPSDTEPTLERTASGALSSAGTAIEWVVKHKQPFISGDITNDVRFREQAGFVAEHLKSQLNIPLIVKDRILGSLNFVAAESDAYDDGTVKKLKPVADQLALAIANQKLFEDVARAKTEWETTFDSASEGIAMVGVDHRILRINKAASEMMGGEVSEFVGRRCSDVLHGTASSPDRCLMEKAFAVSASTKAEQEMSDGRTLEMLVDPIYDVEGKPAGAVHFLRDVTEAKRLRQQLMQSEKMIAVGQLVAGVAHEINNPLTGVIGYAQLLQARDIDEQAKKDAEGIYREAERATRIVRHLLSFARKYQPERRIVDVNAVIRESIELKAYELRVNNIKLEAELDENLPLTTADPHQLQQVFLNLITNAEQAIREDRGSGLIKISTQTDGHLIQATITDTGPGIPEDVCDRIFDPFFTTKEVGKGTGLGLSVCFGVAEDHGGRIWAETGRESGARITLEIPVVKSSEAESEQASPELNARLGKVLLVDDEAAIRQVLTETLRQAGHEVDTAVNGKVALRMLKQRRYDCVVSDVKMPLMDGPTLHQATIELNPDLASSFIFISGDTISPETRSYLDHVDNPRLAKPFDLADLESALQQVLARHEDADD